MSAMLEHVTNIRRNIRHMHDELAPGDDRDSRLIDYLNHMDSIAQQIESDVAASKRDDVLRGPTYKARLDVVDRSMYVTVNDDATGRPYEVFIRLDVPELYEWVATTTVLISRLLRAGESLEAIADDLKHIHSPRTSHFHKGSMVPSISARIGVLFDEHLEKRRAA